MRSFSIRKIDAFDLPEGYSLQDFATCLFNYQDRSSQVSREGKRRVIRLVLDNKNYYLKVDEKKTSLQALRYIWKNRACITSMGKEYKNILMCAAAGLPVMDAVFFAERRKLFLPVQGLILVREVDGREFIEIFPELSQELQIGLARKYGSLSALAHKNGISSPIRAQDMIVTHSHPPAVVLIDREHGVPRKIAMNEKRTMRFLKRIFEANDKVVGRFSPELVSAFCGGYLSVRPQFECCLENFSRAYLGHDDFSGK